MAHLENLIIYPIKSLDGVSLDHARISSGGALEFDRQYALFDDQNRFVNGKRQPRVHQIRARFDRSLATVELRTLKPYSLVRFHLVDERKQLEMWFSEVFGFPIVMRQNTVIGFPDDTQSWGPTIISAGTLEEISRWFPSVAAHEILRRFRANLVIGGVPAFWEDHLFGEPGTRVHFQVGSIWVEGINPCKRCVVPSRDPISGERIRFFQKHFVKKRKETLPHWAVQSRFDHYYRLAVNSQILPSETGKTMRVGDEFKVGAP